MLKLNGHVVNVTKFPDGTSQVWKLSEELLVSCELCDKYRVTWIFENEGELFQIFQLLNFLVGSFKEKPVVLNCPFLPYSRQDKEVSNKSCSALNTFCMIIGVFVDELQTFDVHNPSFFENKKLCPFKFTNILPYDQINKIIKEEKIDLLIFPDEGASTRYPDLHLSEIKSVSADKIRDQLTGEIIGLELPPITIGASVLVVDDLCDGGRTFIELAKAIKNNYPVEVILYVSHGIFSKGIKTVFDAGYDKIYTKDGLQADRSSYLEI